MYETGMSSYGITFIQYFKSFKIRPVKHVGRVTNGQKDTSISTSVYFVLIVQRRHNNFSSAYYTSIRTSHCMTINLPSHLRISLVN